jgi:hypothetical protein
MLESSAHCNVWTLEYDEIGYKSIPASDLVKPTFSYFYPPSDIQSCTHPGLPVRHSMNNMDLFQLETWADETINSAPVTPWVSFINITIYFQELRLIIPLE